MLISSNINLISTISWILWKLKGPPPDAVIICKLDEYIYTPHKLLAMPNIFLIYSRSISLTPFKPQAFEILMPKSSIFFVRVIHDSFDSERDFNVRFATHLI